MIHRFDYSKDMPEFLLNEDEYRVNSDPRGFIDETLKITVDLVKYTGHKILSLLDINRQK